MDKTFIKDLLVRGIIGIRDWEREKPQDILINVTVFSDTRRAAETLGCLANWAFPPPWGF